MGMSDFRDQFLAALAASGLNMKQLAAAAGVTYDTVRDLKRRVGATTSYENAVKIARVLGIAVPQSLTEPPAETPRATAPGISLSIDGATVHVEATVDAEGLDELIRRLSLARQMIK
jgi:transcriptional regulator with XRE-family HTH domain